MTTDDKKPDEAAPAQGSSAVSGVTVATLGGGVLGVLGSAAGAGWPGVIALILLGLTIPFGWNTILSLLNKWTDKKDAENAGTDASKTALNLANQGREVSSGLDKTEASDEPTDGFKG